MGSQTAHGLPYPVGTDRVMDGDDAIKALAEAVDTKALANLVQGGSISTMSGTGASWSGSLTWPTPFAATPVSAVITGYSSSATVVWMVAGVSATGMSFYCQWNDVSSHSNSGPAFYMALGARVAG